MEYFIGFLGMPRTSQVIVCDNSGHILSVIKAPPLTIRIDPNITENIRKTLDYLSQKFGISLPEFIGSVSKICIAMAGVYLPQDEIALKEIIINIGFETDKTIIICENMYADLVSSLNNHGIVVRAGTGSCVLIKLPNHTDQSTIRVDGWGSSLGDDGSGYDLGRKCLRALLKAADGRKPPSVKLLNKVLSHVGLFPNKNNASDLVQWYYNVCKTVWYRAQISDLAIPLFEAAEENDPLAYKLVMDGANSLFYSFLTAMKLAIEQCRDSSETSLDLLLLGGLFLKGSIYYRRFENLVARNLYSPIKVNLISPKYSSSIGTMLLAINGEKKINPEGPIERVFLSEIDNFDLLKV